MIDKKKLLNNFEKELDISRVAIESAELPEVRMILQVQHGTVLRIRDLILSGIFDVEA